LDERSPKGGRDDSGDATNIFEDRDAEILLPYGSPELKSADTDDFEELTMDGMYLIIRQNKHSRVFFFM
jgi:hypothetical protein